MRKTAILLSVCLVLTLAGCQLNDNTNPSGAAGNSSVANTSSAAINETRRAKTDRKSGNVVGIKENLFIAQLNDIYLNQDDYLGKTIKYEGMFTRYTWEENKKTYYLVYRKSPGCCGADGQAGFEVVWSENSDKPYPNENDWVEVVGVLEQYDEDGRQYLRIALSSLTVKQERGAEFVSQ